jgi:hypothetical protein
VNIPLRVSVTLLTDNLRRKNDDHTAHLSFVSNERKKTIMAENKVHVIEKLTAEQEAMLPLIAKECLEYGVSTAPLDREKCLAAAKLCYTLAGEKVPPDSAFEFLPSPDAGMARANQLEGNAKPKFIAPFYGCHEMGFLSFYIAFQRFGIEAIDQMNGLISLAQNAGWTWFFDEACIITERPVELKLDESGRLHNLSGMAVRYSDGWGLYSSHGIVVPERIIMNPESLTPKEIDDEPNAELRRVMIECYGQENYLLNGGASEIHKDEFGTLFRKAVPNDEDLVMVRVTNSTPEPDGSLKDYFLRVPPTTKTAREAVGWSFAIPEAHYSLVKET